MMEVADAHKSIATFRTIVTGLEAHSAKPALGANAVACACDIVARDLSPGRGPRGARSSQSALRSPLFDASRRHDSWRYGAQHIWRANACFIGSFAACRAFDDGGAAHVQAYIDAVALPRLTRFVAGPKSRPLVEVDVPGLDAEPGSAGRNARFEDSRAPTGTHAVPTPPRPGNSRRPACRPWFAGRARSIRRTSPTNSSRFRRSKPASTSWRGWRRKYRPSALRSRGILPRCAMRSFS